MDAAMSFDNFYDRADGLRSASTYFFIGNAADASSFASSNANSSGAVNREDGLIILWTRPLAELVQG